ncbi:splicing factor 3B subunit 4-like [Macrobrachium nipponense]|uniref:splicing factor 3B subunit 4-like n=1 Tax=Macrobrachium nipponense TaxID=159736 RepID=UPI0030C8AD43
MPGWPRPPARDAGWASPTPSRRLRAPRPPPPPVPGTPGGPRPPVLGRQWASSIRPGPAWRTSPTHPSPWDTWRALGGGRHQSLRHLGGGPPTCHFLGHVNRGGLAHPPRPRPAHPSWGRWQAYCPAVLRDGRRA